MFDKNFCLKPFFEEMILQPYKIFDQNFLFKPIPGETIFQQ
jgi:hypothetical protein